LAGKDQEKVRIYSRKGMGTYVQDIIGTILLAKAIDGQMGCYECRGDETILDCIPNEDV
jgi:hypothetical protein